MDWEDLKRAQRGNQTVAQAMEGVSRALPALWRADKLLSKAERSGMDRGELPENLEAHLWTVRGLEGLEPEQAQTCLGDALLSLVRLARNLGQDPEAALNGACERFIAGFSRWEAEQAEAPGAVREAEAKK